MNEQMRTKRGRVEGRLCGRAFTLVELLVVIGIIAILASILVPTVTKAYQLSEASRTRSWIQELQMGCERYYNDFKYYPGQADLPDNTRTGSQMLAAALFNYSLDPAVVNAKNPPGDGKYCSYKPTEDLKQLSGRMNTISDRTSNPRAVLYFPARLGETRDNQFKWDDNKDYFNKDYLAPGKGDSLLDGNSFLTYINNDPNYANRPMGKYLIIAPGIDRVYGPNTGNSNICDDIRFPDW